MDQQTFEEMVPRVEEKVMGMLVNEFKRLPREDCEDATQIALLKAFRRVNTFTSERGLLAYLYETAKMDTIHNIEREKGRAETRASLPSGILQEKPIAKDPYVRLDWQIDLERSIRRAINDPVVQSCMWDHAYEGWEIEEIAMKLPPTRTVEAWRSVLVRARKDVKREMKRGGYRGIRG